MLLARSARSVHPYIQFFLTNAMRVRKGVTITRKWGLVTSNLYHTKSKSRYSNAGLTAPRETSTVVATAPTKYALVIGGRLLNHSCITKKVGRVVVVGSRTRKEHLGHAQATNLPQETTCLRLIQMRLSTSACSVEFFNWFPSANMGRRERVFREPAGEWRSEIVKKVIRDFVVCTSWFWHMGKILKNFFNFILISKPLFSQ